jgi:hypothetical protein
MTTHFSDQELALHEAGHTVLQVLLGGRVTRVSIVRDEPSRGVQLPSGTDPLPGDPAAVHDRAVVLLGGEAAQHIRNPASPRHADSTDRKRAERLLATIAAADLEPDWSRALAILRMPENWQRVQRLADVLVRKRVVDGVEAERIVRGEHE